MLPLRDRAAGIYAAAREHAAGQHAQFVQGERASLKQYAKGLKQALELQQQGLAAQQAKVEALAAQPDAPAAVHAGFNVIRARVTADGRPLPTDELTRERERLTAALNQLAIDIAAAKAEIKSQRRAEEVEIWETQLVALQDTLRVYRQEINIIEVELLGREQQERIERERAAAEASGLAQLQRLQEQATQTRIRFNRAKQQYHFPPPAGYNITFGGGGIYGALKDITLSEVHGNASVTGEVVRGPRAGSGSSSVANGAAANGMPARDDEPRARLVILFGLANSPIGGPGAAAASGSGSGTVTPQASPRKAPASNHDPGGRRAGGSAAAATSAAAGPQAKQQPGLSRLSSGGRPPAGGTPRAASSAGSSSSRAGAAGAGPSGQGHAPPASPPQQPPQQQPPVQRKPSKAKAMAVRFLNRIGSKKDKYQGKEQPQLQPSESDPGSKRTLAGKLLGRKSSRMGDASPRISEGLDAALDLANFQSQHLETSTTGLSSMGEGPSRQFSDSLLEEDEEGEGDGGEGDGGSVHGEERVPGDSPGHLVASASQPNLTEQANGGGGGRRLMSPLTREALQHAAAAAGESSDSGSSSSDSESEGGEASREGSPEVRLPGGYEPRGAWLRNRGSSGADAATSWGGASSVDASDMDAVAEAADSAAAGPGGKQRVGVHVVGRVTGFELVGERGSKVPNLSLAQGDVEGHVLVRFVFEYTKLGGWQPAEKPVFDVTRLHTRLRGNNVPMPDSLIKTILRMAIPGLIQRKLLGVIPKELGSYLLEAGQGFHLNADVALVGTPLSVLDADLSFEVRGPAKSAAEAKKQQLKYAAAKEARRLLGLSLPQAQVLAELFRGKDAVLELPHPVSIFQLIALQRHFDGQPQLYAQLCQVLNTGYQMLAERGRVDVGDFSFRQLMDGPVSRMRRKPSRVRVIMHRVEAPVDLDALLTAVRDYFQRALEELLIKGPLANPRDNPEYHEDDVPLEEQVEVLHAWHAWMLQELSHFKSKFGGAGGTLLGAASARGFSAGVENLFYEGPLRVRVPVSMQLDADGAFSFDIPLPSAEGAIGEFVDGVKSRLVPAHMRPPPMAINWIPPTGDTEVDSQMEGLIREALGLVQRVLDTLSAKVEEQGAAKMDEDPVAALSQPRTAVGDRLGRMIVNRLRVHVRLDERRISEILQGIDSRSMGAGFVATAGRILGHLGDVMTLGFTPAATTGTSLAGATSQQQQQDQQRPQQYLFVFESSDISRLRADVQSLGFQSLITPGGAVRLVHAVARAFLSAFKHVPLPVLRALDERCQGWYQHMSRESLDVSLCLDAKGGVSPAGTCVVTLSGTAEEAALRETSPLVAVNDLELVPLAHSLWGLPPPAAWRAAQEQQQQQGAGS